MDYELWMERAKSAIEREVRVGKKFEVKDLFPGHEWTALSKGERISFGKYFSDAVREERITSVKRCEEGKSHHNQYVKKSE